MGETAASAQDARSDAALPTPSGLSWACAAVAAAAAAALAGKAFELRVLASGVSSSVPMAPWTAGAFLSLAAAAHPALPWSGSRRARAALLLPTFILPLPALTGLTWLYANGGWAAVKGAGPFDPWVQGWAMSPLTAALFLVLGGSVAAGPLRGAERRPAAPAWGAALAAVLSGFVLIGYLYGVPLFYGGPLVPMAATTALCFLVFSVGLLAEAGRGLRPWSLLEGDAPRARMMRWFLPLFAGFVLLTGFLNARFGAADGPLVAAAILLGSLPVVAWSVARASATLDAEIAAAERGLRESRERFSLVFESNPAKLAMGTLEGTIVDVNRAYAEFLGFSRAELVGKSLADLGVLSPEELRRLLSLGRTPEAPLRHVEVSMRTRGGELRDVLLSADVISLGGVPHRLASLVDITERKRAEEERKTLQAQLAQSQKMESVGRLAGGVAHDFNNILTAIIGYTRFALTGLPESEQRTADLKEALAAAERAARLTKQLLAFSRKQVLVPEVVDVNVAVSAVGGMLRRLIGEDYVLETRLASRPCLAKVDPGQLDQVFLNLALNARDAMDAGGTIAIETELVDPTDELLAKHPGLARAPLVRLSVRDAGAGMSDEVKARLFEPFFTTKPRGKGTGLGLSMVYGIVKQSGGEIEVESALGRGTTVRVYLPQATSPAPAPAPETPAAPGGRETVLLVEDEDGVRRLGERSLAAAGYGVLAVADGQEALALLERRGGPVDLLLTDVVMPGMSGRELAREVARRKLAARTLFVSGYTDDAVSRHGALEPGLAFLNKPFSPDVLLRKVREVLDGPADQAKA